MRVRTAFIGGVHAFLAGAILLGSVGVAAARSSGGGGTRSDFLSNLGRGVSAKADERYQNRWTLSDWFETQRKTRLQDMWLAGNQSDDIYEFMIGGRTGVRSEQVNAADSGRRYRQTSALAAAYATLVGLEGAYTDVENESWGYDGSFALRLIGDSMQNSNLTLSYGVRFREDSTGEKVQQQYPRAALTLYINRAFGLEGQYQYHMTETSNLSADLSGSQVEGGAFIDFSLLRIFGTWSRETRKRKLSGTETERVRESIDFGLKAFF